VSTPNELRAEALKGNGKREAPNGVARSQPFAAQLSAETLIWQDSERNKVHGYASIVGKKYKMWDMFGEYSENVSPGAFDVTLAKSPDVAFLVNHRGVTMARTTNGSLELSSDSRGLKSVAYLNPKRNDVKDLVLAIEDKDITEMSFAFLINDGQWNEEYTEYTINEVDLHRGDVSAVNYGANPYTSVSARQLEVIRDFRLLPTGAQREAMSGLDSEASTLHTDDKGISDAHTLDVEHWLAVELLSN
jgi:HK97 family phage prohead protease